MKMLSRRVASLQDSVVTATASPSISQIASSKKNTPKRRRKVLIVSSDEEDDGFPTMVAQKSLIPKTADLKPILPKSVVVQIAPSAKQSSEDETKSLENVPEMEYEEQVPVEQSDSLSVQEDAPTSQNEQVVPDLQTEDAPDRAESEKKEENEQNEEENTEAPTMSTLTSMESSLPKPTIERESVNNDKSTDGQMEDEPYENVIQEEIVDETGILDENPEATATTSTVASIKTSLPNSEADSNDQMEQESCGNVVEEEIVEKSVFNGISQENAEAATITTVASIDPSLPNAETDTQFDKEEEGSKDEQIEHESCENVVEEKIPEESDVLENALSFWDDDENAESSQKSDDEEKIGAITSSTAAISVEKSAISPEDHSDKTVTSLTSITTVAIFREPILVRLAKASLENQDVEKQIVVSDVENTCEREPVEEIAAAAENSETTIAIREEPVVEEEIETSQEKNAVTENLPESSKEEHILESSTNAISKTKNIESSQQLMVNENQQATDNASTDEEEIEEIITPEASNLDPRPALPSLGVGNIPRFATHPYPPAAYAHLQNFQQQRHPSIPPSFHYQRPPAAHFQGIPSNFYPPGFDHALFMSMYASARARFPQNVQHRPSYHPPAMRTQAQQPAQPRASRPVAVVTPLQQPSTSTANLSDDESLPPLEKASSTESSPKKRSSRRSSAQKSEIVSLLSSDEDEPPQRASSLTAKSIPPCAKPNPLRESKNPLSSQARSDKINQDNKNGKTVDASDSSDSDRPPSPIITTSISRKKRLEASTISDSVDKQPAMLTQQEENVQAEMDDALAKPKKKKNKGGPKKIAADGTVIAPKKKKKNKLPIGEAAASSSTEPVSSATSTSPVADPTNKENSEEVILTGDQINQNILPVEKQVPIETTQEVSKKRALSSPELPKKKKRKASPVTEKKNAGTITGDPFRKKLIIPLVHCALPDSMRERIPVETVADPEPEKVKKKNRPTLQKSSSNSEPSKKTLRLANPNKLKSKPKEIEIRNEEEMAAINVQEKPKSPVTHFEDFLDEPTASDASQEENLSQTDDDVPLTDLLGVDENNAAPPKTPTKKSVEAIDLTLDDPPPNKKASKQRSRKKIPTPVEIDSSDDENSQPKPKRNKTSLEILEEKLKKSKQERERKTSSQPEKDDGKPPLKKKRKITPFFTRADIEAEELDQGPAAERATVDQEAADPVTESASSAPLLEEGPVTSLNQSVTVENSSERSPERKEISEPAPMSPDIETPGTSGLPIASNEQPASPALSLSPNDEPGPSGLCLSPNESPEKPKDQLICGLTEKELLKYRSTKSTEDMTEKELKKHMKLKKAKKRLKRELAEREENEKKKRKDDERARKNAAFKEREEEKRRQKIEKRKKEEEERKQEEEEIKRQNEEREAAAAEEARRVEQEALERAAERRKREEEEAEGNEEPKEDEDKNFHEFWLTISYKSGCTGQRLVEYTSDEGKVWLEKQLLLSLNDKIAKKKRKYWCSFEHIYPLEFGNSKLVGVTDIRTDRNPKLGQWEVNNVYKVVIGPDTILYDVEFKKYAKGSVVSQYGGTRKSIETARHWLAHFEMDFYLKNPEDNKEMTQRVKNMILRHLQDESTLERYHIARQQCMANRRREGHFAKEHAKPCKDSDFDNSKVSMRVIGETGELVEKKNYKKTREEMLAALDDIDSYTSICKLPKTEQMLTRSKANNDFDDVDVMPGSYNRQVVDKFAVRNELFNPAFLKHKQEQLNYLRNRLKAADDELKRAEEYFRSNQRHWKETKQYNLVREHRWTRDRKSMQLKILQKRLMDAERFMFPTHKKDDFPTDAGSLKDDTRDMIFIQQGIYGLRDKRESMRDFQMISEREEVRLENMKRPKQIPLAERQEFKKQ